VTNKRYSLDTALVVIAVVVRVASVVVLQSHHVARSTYEHGEIAANVLAGRGFSIKFLGAEGPTSQQAPVYPLAVAAAYAVGGVEQPAALLSRGRLVGRADLGGTPEPGVRRHTRPGCARGSDATGLGFVLGLPRGDDGLRTRCGDRGRSPGTVGFDRSDSVARGYWHGRCHRLGPSRTALSPSSSV
jgi:hypothetical protein